MRKGLVLAGGLGSRLHPVTLSVSKQLLPIYDKPTIYYSLSILFLAKISEIAIITSKEHLGLYKNLLGDGKQFGVSFNYIVQEHPGGIAEAYILAEDFLCGCPSALILGDNFFYGDEFKTKLLDTNSKYERSSIFCYRVKHPENFGILEVDNQGQPRSIVEKPPHYLSDMAVTGLYFLDGTASDRAKKLKPSARGELEITSLLQCYLEDEQLDFEELGRGYTWFDTGSADNLLAVSNFVKAIQDRHGFQIACLEEIALHNGWITHDSLIESTLTMGKSAYREYLEKIWNK
jgi:glucose-1-phosphate thymidylyltransferase